MVRSGPVAVVGVGCRLPGGVCSFEGFWEFLRAGGDGVVEVPGDRWDVDALFDPDPDAPGRTYARHGGFIGGVDGFDDRFFGISPREAVAMDPQQRLVLEVGWEALEHAGIAPDGLRDSETGVFVGLGANDYLLRGSRSLDPADLDAYVGTGNASSVVSGRLSYVLGLRGPSMVVDTACSSSLVAVHLACQSLRGGECDLALAGGVNLMLASDTTIVLSKARMLSASGRCRTFDAAADGYVRGEGCGILVLRRLQDAIAAHDTVLAVIRGSAVNQDGHSNGLTAPRASAQEGVVARALAMAGVTGSEVGYVEAHGTGTALGDPIEVGALARVLAGEREHPLLVGSVKTNIGHLEAAAGVAGLIKAVLVVAHGEVPPHLHLREPNPRIPWQELSLRVPTQITPLPAGRRIAGVSSFGFSGTNAHVIVEGPPLSPASPDITPSTHDVPSAHDAPSTHDRVIVKLAAHGQPALTASAQRLACWVEQHTEVQLNALAWTANVARAELPDRAAVIAASQGELLQGLRSIATGTPKRGVVRGQTPVRTPPKSAFLVPGQGSHAAGAAAELYHTQPVFRHTLDRLAEILGPHQQLPLLALFDPGADSQRALAMTEHAQPALYALAVALGEWWRAAGVTPDALVGHSVGAYAAAALAGVLSLEDGAQLVCVRGQLMSTLPAGAMAAVFTNEDTARTILADTQPDKQAITLAAVNTPTEIVLAGEPHQLQHVLAQFTAQGIASKQLTVAHAFHTHHVEPILDQLEQELTRTTLNPPTTPLISDTTGKLAEEQATTPAYWIHHTRHPTNFNNALQTLKQLGCHQLIELGPTTTLLGMAQATLQPTPTLLPSLRPHHPPTQQLLQSTATAWTNGTPLHWQNLNNPPNTPPHLPTYPFQHRTHWPHTKHTHDPSPSATPQPAERSPAAGDSGAAMPAPDQRNGTPGIPNEQATELIEQLGKATPSERTTLVTRHVRREVAAALALDAAEVRVDDGLFDLGLDSLMALDLKTSFEQAFGLELANTLVFDYPTIDALAEHLLAVLGSAEPKRNGRRPQKTGYANEPIAIVGMACRFPGGANDLDSYWRLLSNGVDAIGEIPSSRWNVEEFYDPDPGAPLKMYTKCGGFLDVPVDRFDADMFGISPREASSMDPQQRLLLEVTWEAFEDAGVVIDAAAGSPCGVFVGITTADYAQLLASGGLDDIDAHLTTGNAFSVAAGRLSYVFGLRGPSVAVDTACSSSLVATHLASQSLRSGEVDMAVVAGVNLMLSPATTIGMAKLRALSPDGRCKAFDATADGYGRGEGCGVVVLKRLADARCDGDRVWALVRGSAVNQDGRSAGLTVPNGPAQYDLIRQALHAAAVDPARVSYVEAHGTGTPLGDPIELQALAAALRDGHDVAHPIVVGSVKTNIGHLEAAAGVAGVIKVALSLRHQQIPPHLHFDTPSPHVPWDELPVSIPTEPTPWSSNDGQRVAGISSFGFSGTNAHVILQEAPAQPVAKTAAPGALDILRDEAPERAQLLLLSARSPDALKGLALKYQTLLTHPDGKEVPPFDEICAAAAVRRSHHRHRLSLVACPSHAADGLAAYAAGVPAAYLRVGRVHGERNLLFAFCGQGAHWIGMGRQLLEQEPVFREILQACDDLTRDHAGWSLIEELGADEQRSRLDDTEVAQPVLFGLQAGLCALWRSWSVTPQVVVGHSVGEIAAAWAAGALDLEDAMRVAIHRGRVMQPAKGRGAMAVLGLSEQAIAEMLAEYGPRLSLAAINGPATTVVAGEIDAVEGALARAKEHNAFAQRLSVPYAFHSAQMAPFGPQLEEQLEGVGAKDAVHEDRLEREPGWAPRVRARVLESQRHTACSFHGSAAAGSSRR